MGISESDNLEELLSRKPALILAEEDAKKIVDFLHGLNTLKRVDLLPFHRLGRSKYTMLDRNCIVDIEPPDKRYVERIKKILESGGIKVSVGGLI